MNICSPNIDSGFCDLMRISCPALVFFCILKILSFQCGIIATPCEDILTKMKFNPCAPDKMDSPGEVRRAQGASDCKRTLLEMPEGEKVCMLE